MRTVRNRGQALIIALIVVLCLGVLSASMVVMTVANATASQNGLRRAVALTLADIGLQRVKAKIAEGVLEEQFERYGAQATDSDIVSASGMGNYGSYVVRVTQNYGDVAGQYLVVSQGTTGGTTRQISVVIRRTPPEIPPMPAALTFYSPTDPVTFRGVPPRVTGCDTNIPESKDFSSVKISDCIVGSGEGPDVIGIGVQDDPSAVSIIAALGNRTTRVTGVAEDNGVESASIYNVTTENPSNRIDTMTADDVTQLARQYEALADAVYESNGNSRRSVETTGERDLGTVERPRVIVLRDTAGGTVQLNGNVSGAGILIIDGPVSFGGSFNYAGLVIITRRGNSSASVKMRGTPLVLGVMLVANPDDEVTSGVDLRGTVDVLYSRQGLACAEQALTNRAKFQTIYYTEQKPRAQDVQISQP